MAGTAETSRSRSREISTQARDGRSYPDHAGCVRHRDVIAVHAGRQLYGHLFGQSNSGVRCDTAHGDHVVRGHVSHVPCETAHQDLNFVGHLLAPRISAVTNTQIQTSYTSSEISGGATKFHLGGAISHSQGVLGTEVP